MQISNFKQEAISDDGGGGGGRDDHMY